MRVLVCVCALMNPVLQIRCPGSPGVMLNLATRGHSRSMVGALPELLARLFSPVSPACTFLLSSRPLQCSWPEATW